MTPAPDEINNLWDDPAYQDIKMKLLQELLSWMVSTEQPDGMGTDWEQYIDTAWYKWLAKQPGEAEIAEGELTNEK